MRGQRAELGHHRRMRKERVAFGALRLVEGVALIASVGAVVAISIATGAAVVFITLPLVVIAGAIGWRRGQAIKRARRKAIEMSRVDSPQARVLSREADRLEDKTWTGFGKTAAVSSFLLMAMMAIWVIVVLAQHA